MYELANMAVSKAQELNFPPPPPEESLPNENSNFHNEKVNNSRFCSFEFVISYSYYLFR